MADPSPEAVAAIRAKVLADVPGGFAANDDPQIAGLLNAPSVPNPTPRGTVTLPVDEGALLQVIRTDPATVDAVKRYPHLDRVLDSLENGNIPGALRWFALLTGGTTPEIPPSIAAQIAPLIGATAPDPGWAAQIGWALATLGRAVDHSDVAAAREAH